MCRGQSPEVTIVRMSQLLETVGLSFSARAYPGGAPVRDRGHVALLERLRRRIPSTLEWRVEVPVVPMAAGPPDLRAWDAVIVGPDWRIGIEAETRVRDSQSLCRRTSLKLRDGDVDGVVLLLTDSRWHRELLRLAGPELRTLCPVAARPAMQALSAGLAPTGNALIVL